MTDSASTPTRTEADSIGSLEIPTAAYWGVHTARTANEAALEDTVARSVTVITALAPVIGYAPAAQLAKQALATNEPIADLVVAQGLLDPVQLEEILKPERLTGLPADHGVENTADSAEAVPRDEMTSELPVVPSPE